MEREERREARGERRQKNSTKDGFKEVLPLWEENKSPDTHTGSYKSILQ